MCIINHTFKFIFVHSPKCAGTSVTAYYSPLTSYCDLEIGSTKFGESIAPAYIKRFGIEKHSTYSEISAIVGSVVARAYFSFSFVRNPYHRAVSIFYFLKNWKSWRGSEIMNRFSTFEEYVTSEFFQEDGPDRINRPQIFWFSEKLGCPNLGVNFVGRVENLNEDLMSIDKFIAVPSWFKESANLKKTNITKRSDEKVLTDNAAEAVAKRYSLDFDTFGYSLEPPKI